MPDRLKPMNTTTDTTQARLIELESVLRPKWLLFAKGLLAGKSQQDAYADAGYSPTRADVNASILLKKEPLLREYVELCQQQAREEAQEELKFTEQDWLAAQLDVLAMATGKKAGTKSLIVDGQAVEVEVKEINLNAANTALQTVARRHGWLTDNNKTQLKGEGITFNLDLGDK